MIFTKKRIRKYLAVISIFAVPLLLNKCSNYYTAYQYGKNMNAERTQLGIATIPDDWYLSNNSNKKLRYSIVPIEDLGNLIDSSNFRGYIEKFIFLDESHEEEAVFIISDTTGTQFYREHYFFDKKEKICTVDQPSKNGLDTIDCSMIDTLFFNKVLF